MTRPLLLLLLCAACSGDSASNPLDSTPDFAISLDASANVSLHAGGTTKATVHVARTGGHFLPVTISLADAPLLLTMEPITVYANESSGAVTLTASQADYGDFSVRLVATDGVQRHDVGVAVRVAPPSGTLDPNFGSNGTLATKVDHGFGDVIVDRQNRILLAGTAYAADITVRRYDFHGLDEGFGSGGTAAVHAPMVFNTAEAELAVDDGGGLAVAGDQPFECPPTEVCWGLNPFVARLTSAGALDTSFGGGAGYQVVTAGPTNLRVNGLVVGNDGVPWLLAYDNVGLDAVRFDPGSYVRDVVSLDGTPSAFTRDASGRRLVATTDGDATKSRLYHARILTDGRVDPSFGTQGKAQLSFPGAYDSNQIHPTFLTVDADGSIFAVTLLVGGAVCGLDADGHSVASFGSSGCAAVHLFPTPTGIAVAGDGVFVADETMIAKLRKADGALDTGFGNQGWYDALPVVSRLTRFADDFLCIVVNNGEAVMRLSP
jgi:hypothetical protein